MSFFYLRVCDHSGRLLSRRTVEVADVNAALCEANRRVADIAALKRTTMAPPARIDVANGQGRTVARIVWSEALAAMG